MLHILAVSRMGVRGYALWGLVYVNRKQSPRISFFFFFLKISRPPKDKGAVAALTAPSLTHGWVEVRTLPGGNGAELGANSWDD